MKLASKGVIDDQKEAPTEAPKGFRAQNVFRLRRNRLRTENKKIALRRKQKRRPFVHSGFSGTFLRARTRANTIVNADLDNKSIKSEKKKNGVAAGPPG